MPRRSGRAELLPVVRLMQRLHLPGIQVDRGELAGFRVDHREGPRVRDHGHQVAEQVRVAVPMKLEAGGKPWRRKPSEAPAVVAASTPAALRSSDSAITASAAAEIRQTPAACPSTPSIRLITLATATMPNTVST